MIDPVTAFVDRNIIPWGSLSLDVVKQGYNLIFLFIFSFVWALVKSPKFKLTFSILGGLLVLFFDFGLYPTVFLLIAESSGYFLLLLNKIQEHPFILMLYVFLLDFGVYFYYFVTNYGEWRMDIASPLMLFVQKSSSLAWNLYDYKHKDDVSLRRVSEHLKRAALEKPPSFFNFFSYVLFPVSINLGPSVEYNMFMESVNCTEIPQGNKRFRWVAQNFLIGMFFMINFAFPADIALYVHDTERRRTHNILQRLFGTWVRAHYTRFKYYGPWSLTNALMIICGIGYENGSWDHALCLLSWRVEMGRRPRDLIKYWNCGTQRFLKNYLYVRGPILKSGQVHPAMLLVTNILSGLWHGWYSGYLIAFGGVMLITYTEWWYYAVIPLHGYEEFKPYGQLPSPAGGQPGKGKGKGKSGEGKKKGEEEEKEGEEKQEEEEGEKNGNVIEITISVTYLLRVVIEWIVTQWLIDFCFASFVCLTWPEARLLDNYIDNLGSIAIFGLFVTFFVLSRLTGKKKKGRQS